MAYGFTAIRPAASSPARGPTSSRPAHQMAATARTPATSAGRRNIHSSSLMRTSGHSRIE